MDAFRLEACRGSDQENQYEGTQNMFCFSAGFIIGAGFELKANRLIMQLYEKL